MKLYIARHGQASFNAGSDRERCLTVVGKHATETLFEAHKDQLLAVNRIWASPLKRAQQTAEILSGFRLEMIETQLALEPDEEPARVLELIDAVVGQCQSLMLVSHQPLVGDLVSLLCRGNLFEPHPFATSEIVVIDLEVAAPGMGEMRADYLP